MKCLFKIHYFLLMGLLLGLCFAWGLSYCYGVYSKSFAISIVGHDAHGRATRYAIESGRVFIVWSNFAYSYKESATEIPSADDIRMFFEGVFFGDRNGTWVAPAGHMYLHDSASQLAFAGLEIHVGHDEPLAGPSPDSIKAAFADERRLTIPFWLIACALVIVPFRRTVSFYKNRSANRRLIDELCPTCHYDLRAHHPGDKCPECGRVFLRNRSYPARHK